MYSKQKEFAAKRSNFLLFSVDLSQTVSRTVLIELHPLNISIPLNLIGKAYISLRHVLKIH